MSETPTGTKARIVFMGTPEFATGPLKALMEAEFDIAAVVTVPDKPSGRGLKMNFSAVKEYVLSLDRKIPILQPENLKDPEFLAALEKINADMFVVVAFRMLPKVVWSMPPMGTFNLHASLLPKYRGAAPINWAIINGETVTGVTTFLLDEKIDTGAILFQEETPILPEDNIGTLYDRLMAIGSNLTVKTAEALGRGEVTPLPQTEPAEPCSAPKITRETMEIDWNDDARSVLNLIRGLSPYPATHTTLYRDGNSTDVKIFSGRMVSEEKEMPAVPGRITSDGKKHLYVETGRGRIEILELQIAGKKRLRTPEFLAGWHSGWDDVRFGR